MSYFWDGESYSTLKLVSQLLLAVHVGEEALVELRVLGLDLSIYLLIRNFGAQESIHRRNDIGVGASHVVQLVGV